ncbi:MAG: cardiolipin synthase [Dysgonamonadaceae bacterium]|jgi:cardiolipin synthase|nr:cardiolipin synthase [Dysgonamonadaceae bacterium]
METQVIVRSIIQIIYFITALGIVFVIISENRNPLKTISWALLLLLFPVGGIIIYYFFGQDARKLRIISRKSYRKLKKRSYERLVLSSDTEAYMEYRTLAKLLNKNNDSALLQGSEIKIFTNGKEKFDALIRDLESAVHHIHLQYYIFEDDKIGNRIKEILIRKAGEGIQVRVLYDDVANWKVKNRFYDEMQTRGVEVTPYLKVYFPVFTSKVNYRNHRKIVVIDGKTGYIGGMNIADRYLESGWKDTHLRVTGRGVLGMQSAFLIDWYSSGKDFLTGKVYFPEMPVVTNNVMQIVTGDPMGEWKTLLQATTNIIMRAKHYVYIQTPYFLPTEGLFQSLQSAALSGIDVRLMVPEHSDTRFVGTAAHSYFEEMMNAGVKIYQMQPDFLHSKLMVSDDFISVVGSANMDFRSFEHNFEVNAYIYDADFAKNMKQIFFGDMQQCTQINLKDWKNRSRIKKFQESLLRMFAPLL